MDELEEIKKKKVKEMMEKIQYPNKVVEVTDENLDSIIAKYPLVVIDCWAEWCFPCKMVTPIINELAKEYKGKIVFGKLNVRTNEKTAKKFNVMAIPNLLIFKNGKFIDRIVGSHPKEIIEELLREHLEYK